MRNRRSSPLRKMIVVIAFLTLLHGCSDACFEGEFDSAMPMRHIADEGRFFEKLDSRGVRYAIEELDLSGPLEEHVCTRKADDAFVLEALALARGLPSPIDYEAIAYGAKEAHRAYIQALDAAAIPYVLVADRTPPTIWTQRKHSTRVQEIRERLFGITPSKLSIGFQQRRQAQALHDELDQLGISSAVVHSHGAYFVQWAPDVDLAVTELLKDRRGIDLEGMRSQIQGPPAASFEN